MGVKPGFFHHPKSGQAWMNTHLPTSHSTLFSTKKPCQAIDPAGGDRFKDGRYQVHHKLGWGGFSTVWLTKDKMFVSQTLLLHAIHKINWRCNSIRPEEWVALKILAARSEQEKSLKEIGILRELSNDPSAAEVYAVCLLDDFYYIGPNGCHHCLVFELLGPSLDNVINSCNLLIGEPYTIDNGIDPRVIVCVLRQLLVALAIL